MIKFELTKNEYDEDGELVEAGDVWDFSEMDFDPANE